MIDRVPRLVFGNHRVIGEAKTPIAELGIRTRVDRRAVVGVDHVARRAATRTVIARVIVRAQEVERRVEQSGFGQADEDRIGAILGAQAAIAQASTGPARFFETFGEYQLRAGSGRRA